MTWNVRTYVGPAVAGSLAVLVLLLGASLADAQESDTTLRLSTPLADQRPLPPVVIATPPAAITPAPAFWELISGYEGDTHGSGYGFVGPSYVRPIRPGLAWTARAFGNYLSYQFSGLDGATRVRSPGLSSAVGLRFGARNVVSVSAGPDVKFRRTNVTSADGIVATRTDYGGPFASAIWRDNVFATQFHPEKSQDVGLKLLENFVEVGGRRA